MYSFRKEAVIKIRLVKYSKAALLPPTLIDKFHTILLILPRPK